jgi:hypothetical protein
MRQSDITIGETYLFVATDNPTRKHLEGEPFTVEYKKAVWRKTGRKGSRKQNRFFNADGVGARAEELGEMQPITLDALQAFGFNQSFGTDPQEIHYTNVYRRGVLEIFNDSIQPEVYFYFPAEYEDRVKMLYMHELHEYLRANSDVLKMQSAAEDMDDIIF